jgi:hypothetical protein
MTEGVEFNLESRHEFHQLTLIEDRIGQFLEFPLALFEFVLIREIRVSQSD